MGYSYSDRGLLACDQCWAVGGVRRRKCRFTVTSDTSRGPRSPLPYCQPPALCQACYKAAGGARGVHPDETCGSGARASQAKYDAIQARLDAGEEMVLSASGDWAEWVPEGHVGVLTSMRNTYLVDAGEYRSDRGGFISDYPSATLFEKPAAA